MEYNVNKYNNKRIVSVPWKKPVRLHWPIKIENWCRYFEWCFIFFFSHRYKSYRSIFKRGCIFFLREFGNVSVCRVYFKTLRGQLRTGYPLMLHSWSHRLGDSVVFVFIISPVTCLGFILYNPVYLWDRHLTYTPFEKLST